MFLPIKILDTVYLLENNRADYFLMKNYENNLKNEAILDTFINKNKAINFESYAYYDMIFYKETSETNIGSITNYVKTKGKFYYPRSRKSLSCGF